MKDSIKKLLASDERRAIIPGFGAIQALRDNEGTSLSFNKYLNFDDGKLSSALANDKGISVDEAAAIIADHVKDFSSKLDNGESVVIDGIGSFSNDSDGSLSFAQDDNYSDLMADQPLDFAAPSSEDVKMADATDNSADVNVAPEPDEPLAFVPSDDNYASQEEPSSKKWLWILLILLLLLLIVFGILFLHKDNAVYRFFFGGAEKPATEQVVEPVKEESVTPEPEQTAPAEPQQTKPESAPVTKPEPTAARLLDKRYNIIVGSYHDEAVAIKRVQDLQAKGFSNAFVGIRKDFFVAVIGSFSKLSEAERMQEEIVDGPYHIESWITNSGE